MRVPRKEGTGFSIPVIHKAGPFELRVGTEIQHGSHTRKPIGEKHYVPVSLILCQMIVAVKAGFFFSHMQSMLGHLYSG